MSPIQKYWLATLARDYSRGGSAIVQLDAGELHNPLLREQRTFDGLERRGWVIWRSVDEGYSSNGYQITEAGRAALSAKAPQ